MKELSQVLWEILRERLGAKQAVRANTLVTLVWLRTGQHVSEREIRAAIKHLIENEGRPILSSTRQPLGFFVASSQEEIERYKATLQSRIRSTAQRLRGVDRAGAREFMHQLQGELFGS